ncbi:MAG: hypothetical protein CFE26_15405 [Verrucomicrobiales bacterium VVV1]|nr:MAG: hypothetical protein CFE26_15405 [Verrucomicrobiales bacterium VVV1]
MKTALVLAGLYHLAFGIWVNAWPYLWFDWSGIERPNHPMLWRAMGLISAALGVGLLVAARSPVKHWPVVLAVFLKSTLTIGGGIMAFVNGEIPQKGCWILAIDDLIWWVPLAMILWATVRAHVGIRPTRQTPLTIEEASGDYSLSSGETLAEASRDQTLVLVFLRHFGCTFTRQILRGLQDLQSQAKERGSRLVLVHMLQNGRETTYLGERSGVARIADPRCELYRAFGLGKGGFLELFGPRVWWRGAVAVFKGCGVGHLAGDGLQMPGAFLVRNGRIVAAQPAHSAADLPDIVQLFESTDGAQPS